MKKSVKIILGIFSILIIGIAFSIFILLSESKPNKEKEAKLEKEAHAYLAEHFDENFELYEIMFDEMDTFEAEYRAVAFEKKNYTSFYIYYDEERRELVDTYVAKKWEKEIGEKVRPYLEENIEGLSTTLVYFEDKTIGKTLNIDPLSEATYQDYNIAPTLLVNIDREKEKEDEDFLEGCIAFLQEDMDLKHGKIILMYVGEPSVIFEDHIERTF